MAAFLLFRSGFLDPVFVFGYALAQIFFSRSVSDLIFFTRSEMVIKKKKKETTTAAVITC